MSVFTKHESPKLKSKQNTFNWVFSIVLLICHAHLCMVHHDMTIMAKRTSRHLSEARLEDRKHASEARFILTSPHEISNYFSDSPYYFSK